MSTKTVKYYGFLMVYLFVWDNHLPHGREGGKRIITNDPNGRMARIGMGWNCSSKSNKEQFGPAVRLLRCAALEEMHSTGAPVNDHQEPRNAGNQEHR